MTRRHTRPSIGLVAARRNVPCRATMAAALGAAVLALWGATLACSGRSAPPASPQASPPEPPFEPSQPTSTPLPTVEPSAALAEARAAWREGRSEEALALFAAAARDPLLAAEALLGASAAAADTGDTAGAAEYACAATEQAAAEALMRQAAFACGVRALAAGAPERAAAALARWAATPWNDRLQPYIWAVYASALWRTGDRAGADAVWHQAIASPQGSAALRAAIYEERARLAAVEGDVSGERHWLERLVGAAPTPANWYALAVAAARLGDGEAAVAQLRRIIESAPGSREAALAVAELKAMGAPPDPGLEGYVAYRRGAYADARAVLSAAVEEPGLDPEALAFRLYYLAAAYDDAGFYREAVPIYDRAAATAPASAYAHRARYWAARALEAAGEHRAAAERYRTLALEMPPGEFSGEAAFRTGYLLFLAGAPREALAAWDALPVPRDGRGLYWRGRALQAVGDGTEARKAFAAAAAADPAGFFGREARRALGEPVRSPMGYEPLPPAVPPDWAAIAAWLVGDPSVAQRFERQTAARELLLVGLRGEAEAAVAELERNAATPAALLQALWEAWDAGLADTAARLASRLLERAGGEAEAAPPDLWRLAYPVDFGAALDAAGARYDFDPLFLAALIRQESFWDPDAVSPANAIGLTQVIPTTGEAIAAALGVADFEPSDLTRPASSIAFGAHYLAGQLQRFGNEYHALAAYNAGPGNALRWVGPPGEAPADYVERIPFAETRAYVERVIANYERYLALYR